MVEEAAATAATCPKCNAPITGAADVCSRCGIFFSKWKEREDNVATGNMGRYSFANATSSEFNWTILVIVCLVVLGIFYWVGRDEFFPH